MELIIYVDHSEIIDGKLKELEIAVGDLVELFRSMEPRLITYSVYFNEEKNRMTILHVHPDINSLELHLKTFAPRSSEFKDLIRLISIDIYGPVTRSVLYQLKQKSAGLGGGNVRIHKLQSGFNRLPI